MKFWFILKILKTPQKLINSESWGLLKVEKNFKIEKILKRLKKNPLFFKILKIFKDFQILERL